MTALFLACAGFALYTYALFPLLLHWRARRRPAPVAPTPERWPSVSIVIAAHNEAANLPAKLDSLERLDYPPELVEWVIVSDGSSDGTDRLLADAFAGRPRRTVHHYDVPGGKCHALNAGVELATGEVIVFMDARQPVVPEALRLLVPHLQDPTVGAASGELVIGDGETFVAGSLGAYWRYEKWIRKNQSRIFSNTSVTGALYAIRRADFVPNPDGLLLDDFGTPMSLLKRGLRILYVPGAYAFDRANDDLALEFRRKVRNLAGNWQSFALHRWLFSPSANPVWWQFLSHKVFRLLVPWALMLAFMASVVGDTPFLRAMLTLQLIVYGVGALALLNLPGSSSRPATFLKVFLRLNAAAVVGTVRYFSDVRAVSWR